jgi:hypothetical protein
VSAQHRDIPRIPRWNYLSHSLRGIRGAGRRHGRCDGNVTFDAELGAVTQVGYRLQEQTKSDSLDVPARDSQRSMTKDILACLHLTLS